MVGGGIAHAGVVDVPEAVEIAREGIQTHVAGDAARVILDGIVHRVFVEQVDVAIEGDWAGQVVGAQKMQLIWFTRLRFMFDVVDRSATHMPLVLRTPAVGRPSVYLDFCQPEPSAG